MVLFPSLDYESPDRQGRDIKQGPFHPYTPSDCRFTMETLSRSTGRIYIPFSGYCPPFGRYTPKCRHKWQVLATGSWRPKRLLKERIRSNVRNPQRGKYALLARYGSMESRLLICSRKRLAKDYDGEGARPEWWVGINVFSSVQSSSAISY